MPGFAVLLAGDVGEGEEAEEEEAGSPERHAAAVRSERSSALAQPSRTAAAIRNGCPTEPPAEPGPAEPPGPRAAQAAPAKAQNLPRGLAALSTLLVFVRKK